MDYEARVKLTSSGASGAVLVSAPAEPTLHHFDLWFTTNVATIGTGKYNSTTKITTWTIYLSQQSSDSVKQFSVNSEFTRFPSYRDPAQPLDGIGQYLYPGRFSTPKNP